MTRMHIAGAIGLLSALTACGSKDETACLPKGEKGIVMRTGEAEGYRFVTIRRENGEQVTCTGKNTPMAVVEGDEIDGSTMTRADPTKSD